ncbi:hypothetical protein D0Z07_1960 [Hyphodiscus hymeniophilus]|uniref:Late endosomal/lysosomal adaptor and MAPK and MTOR activator 1 n=1 Tax=Hyphodiscus hymeniophilus TaxID=353542 RepID=A0A9P7AZJ8_9HELO|nr:hypothetical protein D0Z07_1960 [Hyphodiscus hymeniophilus]
MGICASCLGLDRDRELSSEDENSRLLFDDPHASHYGSFGDQGAGTIQADPQEVQRETDALQKVVAQTSNTRTLVPELTPVYSHLVDIFAMVPQNVMPAPNAIFPAHDARLLRYRDVLAKMSTNEQSRGPLLSSESTPNTSDGWISEEEGLDEPKRYKPVRLENVGPLLGGFAEAESLD